MKIIKFLLRKIKFERETLKYKNATKIDQELSATATHAKEGNNFKINIRVLGKLGEGEEQRDLFNIEFEYSVDYEITDEERKIKDKRTLAGDIVEELYNNELRKKIREFYNESGLNGIEPLEF